MAEARRVRRVDDILAFSVGRLTPPKNQSLLLQAFVGCSAAVHQLHLLVVGDGPLHKGLEQEAEQLGLGHKVYFLAVMVKRYEQLYENWLV